MAVKINAIFQTIGRFMDWGKGDGEGEGILQSVKQLRLLLTSTGVSFYMLVLKSPLTRFLCKIFSCLFRLFFVSFLH